MCSVICTNLYTIYGILNLKSIALSEILLKFCFSDDLVVGVRRVELLEQVGERLFRNGGERNADDAVAFNSETKTSFNLSY